MDSQIKVSAFQDDSLGNYDAYDISEKIKKGELICHWRCNKARQVNKS